MYRDSHLHLVDLFEREPDFFEKAFPNDWRGAVSAHDPEEFARSEKLRPLLPPTLATFGLHPQAVAAANHDEDCAKRLAAARSFLVELASAGRIRCIGEAGFDFFGDLPGRDRSAGALALQKEAFEFQVRLARKSDLPLLVHSRKSTDLLLSYAKDLARLPAVIFHSWPGRIGEARFFLDKGVRAYFSFGTTILREAKHALESCAGLPDNRILAETDAPWQSPHGQSWTRIDDIVRVTERIASCKGLDPTTLRGILADTFSDAFGGFSES